MVLESDSNGEDAILKFGYPGFQAGVSFPRREETEWPGWQASFPIQWNMKKTLIEGIDEPMIEFQAEMQTDKIPVNVQENPHVQAESSQTPTLILMH